MNWFKRTFGGWAIAVRLLGKMTPLQIRMAALDRLNRHLMKENAQLTHQLKKLETGRAG